MERKPPALAADDHPPSPPPPPTPAPPSEPPTPADHPTPAEHPSPQPNSPPPAPPSRPVRRSARIRGESSDLPDTVPDPVPVTRNPSAKRQLKRVSTDEAPVHSENLSSDVNPEDTNRSAAVPQVDKPRDPDNDKTDQPSSPDNEPTKPPSESEPENRDPSKSKQPPDPDAKDTPAADDAPADGDDNTVAEKTTDDLDADTQTPQADDDPVKDVGDLDMQVKSKSQPKESQDKENENQQGPQVAKNVPAAAASATDKPSAAEDAVNDEEEDTQPPPPLPEASDEPAAELKASAAKGDISPGDADAAGQGPKGNAEEPASDTAEKPTSAEDAMEVDQPDKYTEKKRPADDSAMEIERPDEPVEPTGLPAEDLEAVKGIGEGAKKKPTGDSPPAVTDSDDEMHQNGDEISKLQSPTPLSPPRTRRRLAIRTPSPESPPRTSKAPLDTPKTAPHKSSRRSESSDDAAVIEKPSASRYETRSSTRGSSPIRTRRRRYSEPVPSTVPVPKSRARRTKKYSRKPIKGDRLRVLWHIDNIYYEGVVDSVLAFRGKRFYDITYDSGEREYYLELTHRKWRFADGRDGDDQDEEEEEEQSVQRDIDYSKYPQIGDRILVMWHVDGKYYPGKVNDIMKANGAWFYDVDYEGGDREFFLDLTVRKWKYPETSEESARHPLVDRKIPKPQPQQKPKAKVKPKPKPKRVARKTVGPGSSSFAAEGSPSQSPPRPSRRQRTLEMLLDDQDGIAERGSPQEDLGPQTQPSTRDEISDVLDEAPGLLDDKPLPVSGTRSEQKPKQSGLNDGEQGADIVPAKFDAFDSFGGDDIDILDEMEPPLPSQTILKRPRTSDAGDVHDQVKPMDTNDVSDIFSDLLRKPALPLPDSLSDPLPPSSPPRTLLTTEKRKESLSQGARPLSPVISQPAPASQRSLVQPASSSPVKSILKRKLAERPFPVSIPKRPASVPRSESRPTPLPPQRRLKTIEPSLGTQEGSKEASKTDDDPNVADIVSVAGIVAKKWAREEVGRISDGIDKLKRQISSLRTLHSKSLSSLRQKKRASDPHADVLPDDEAERQINNLGTNVVTLVRKYRDTVEEREKKLKIQFTRMRTKITEQNEGLMETADVLAQLDIVGLEALKGLQPKVRKKLEVPPPLPSRQASQAYTQPPTYALSTGIPVQQYQGTPNAPGTLGQHNDAIVRNLRRRLADLVTRSEWLGDEVKRLQGREKTLFREKSSALAELRKFKQTPAVADVTTNGRGKGHRPPSRSSLPASKPGPVKPVGITKRRTRGTVSAPTPPTPPSKGSGKALRKTLPRSNSKYKVPPFEPQQPAPQVPPASVTKTAARTIPTRASSSVQPAVTAQMSQPDTVPAASPAQATVATDVKSRTVPSTLQLQMDKQASDLISLTFTVWLLQDESRSEPPSGPGERMDTWVRGCVKKCLSSALTFLTASGGIFRARSTLRADVDNENIYTDWIMAAPSDDEAIERARGNYSLWDPSLRDSEWQAEKRVLRGLTICYQKALALTPAASFSATLMYAKAVLNKAITDFEKFMPVTITVLPSKHTTMPSARPPPAVAPPAKTAAPIRPRAASAALPVGQSNVQGAAPVSKLGGENTSQDKVRASGTSKPSVAMKPVLSTKAAPTSRAQGVHSSGKGIPAASAPPASNASPAKAPGSSKPATSTGASQIQSSAPQKIVNQENNIPQQDKGNSQGARASQANANASASNSGSCIPQGSPQTTKSQKPRSTPLAPDPNSANSADPSKTNATAQKQSQSAPATSSQQKSAALQQLEGAKTGIEGSATKAQTTQGQVKDSTPAKVGQTAHRSPSVATGDTGVGRKPSVPGDTSSALKSGAGQRTAGQSLSGANREKSSSQGEDAHISRSIKPTSQSVGKGTRGSTSKDSQGSQASKPSVVGAVDSQSPVSQSQPVSISKSGASSKLPKTTAQPDAVQKRNTGLSTAAPQSASKSSRAPSKAQPRGQARPQKKSGSSSQSKVTRTQESGKQVHQTEPEIPVTKSSGVSTGLTQGIASIPNTRLQEIPRKNVTLGAPRAPLELPRSTVVPGKGGNVGASVSSGPAATPAQRTYPMLSRNQVRVNTSGMLSTAMLSRNQVTAGKRPQLGTAQMSVPAAPQRRAAPGVQPSGIYGPSDEGDQMEIDAGRDLNRRRGEKGVMLPVGNEHHELEVGRGGRAAIGNDTAPSTHLHASGLPDDSDNPTGLYGSNAPLNVLGRQQSQGSAYQTTGKKQIGFKSLPMAPPRQPSNTGGVAGGGGSLPQLGAHDRVQNSYEAQRTTSAPMDYTRAGEGQTSEYPYGQGGEPVYSPYNASGQERDMPVDPMNPPTPSSFAGLDGYGISLNTDQGQLPRGDSLPATPSDFDRYGVQSPINLERQSSWGTQQQQGQGQGQSQLGHIMNPQRRDGGYSQPQRYQTRGSFQGRR